MTPSSLNLGRSCVEINSTWVSLCLAPPLKKFLFFYNSEERLNFETIGHLIDTPKLITRINFKQSTRRYHLCGSPRSLCGVQRFSDRPVADRVNEEVEATAVGAQVL